MANAGSLPWWDHVLWILAFAVFAIVSIIGAYHLRVQRDGAEWEKTVTEAKLSQALRDYNALLVHFGKDDAAGAAWKAHADALAQNNTRCEFEMQRCLQLVQYLDMRCFYVRG